MAKYVIKNSSQEVKFGNTIFIPKRIANTTVLKCVKVTKDNIDQLIEDNIISKVDDIVKINYNEIKKLVKEKCNKELPKTKIIRLIAIEIDKSYNDNIAEQDLWYYVEDTRIKCFYSNTNFDYYNGNGYGLFRNEFEARFAKNLAEDILNGKQKSKKC